MLSSSLSPRQDNVEPAVQFPFPPQFSPRGLVMLLTMWASVPYPLSANGLRVWLRSAGQARAPVPTWALLTPNKIPTLPRKAR